ncbi:Similar to Uncharacterized protein C26F1.02; acc. no. Q10492 [Pyronema omphalodes CBS 100304]|uniref:Similar to Uncharacterized protein C26F1.02 acc. no. Q10492 n=1 Tax=Pyronema omphalodes (strain CBS 100304) TaxID=1076935 RepID=U4KZJ6_PYROM|nr:Similar to Uncharacterized protein C26F1.02; acc. no. Q10492 [Pyronema omphalodes CBS 100304]
MSDAAEPITVASAVVLPESTKRRASLDTPESSKRARLSPGPEDSHAPERSERRKHGLEEEKKRGKRLFGALLGTIGKFQKDSSSVRARNSAVKRKEVEAKLQEKLKQQDEELDEKRRKEQDDYTLRKRVESRDFEERAVGGPSAMDYTVGGSRLMNKQMQIKNATITAQANMLATTTEPKLYFLPWKLLPAEEETIAQQKETALQTVADNEAAFRDMRKQIEEELQAAGVDATGEGFPGGDNKGHDGHDEHNGHDGHDRHDEHKVKQEDHEMKDEPQDEPDISIHSPSPQDDVAEVPEVAETEAQPKQEPQPEVKTEDLDVVDTDMVIEEGGEDTVIY